MRKLILIIWLSILVSSVAVASEKSNSLILLNAKSQAKTEEAINLIEYYGSEIRHVFVPDVLIGYLPPQDDRKVNGADISYLINYLYLSGPAPKNGCD